MNYEKIYRNFSWDEWHKEFSWHKNKKVNYAFEVTNYQVLCGRGEKAAIISQGKDGNIRKITFQELANATDSLGSAFQKRGLLPGDRFALYAPRSIEYAIVLHAAIKCGAIAVPLFEAFGPDAIRDRLRDCEAKWIYTTSVLEKNIPFSELVGLKNRIVSEDVTQWQTEQNNTPLSLVFGELETPFILHYTSGSTAKPKGVVLAQRAMIGHYVTAKYVLDLKPDDKYWNTGDPGWVTGMVYNFFAPLLLGVAAHIFEGQFQPESWLSFLRDQKITVWYSTPTAFRLLRYYNVPIRDAKALRHIVSAGEPLNPSLIDWVSDNLGIPIHDSWYMTENGHQLINNYPGVPIKKGSMGKCLPGIIAAIIDEKGNELPRNRIGRLAVKTPWPGLMKTIWNNTQKFEAYFRNGWYISGDVAYQDEEGYFWFQGREDDMIKTAAERVSPFEVESALVSHPAVAEAGVIGKPHNLYGDIIKAFIILKPGHQPTDQLKSDIAQHVKKRLSVHEQPREIEFVLRLPKTRSGKIMRRVLRAQETGGQLGDLSTIDSEMNADNKKIKWQNLNL